MTEHSSTFWEGLFRRACLLLVVMGSTGLYAQDVIPSSVDIRLVQGASDDQLLVQLMPHSTAGFGGMISALTVTIRYDENAPLFLGPAISFCPAWSTFPPSAVVVNNGLAYRTYNGFGLNRIGDTEFNGGCDTELIPEEWFTLATIPVIGEGCTVFTLGNDAYTDAENRSFYISLNAWNVTGIVSGGTVPVGDCGPSDCLGMPGGGALPGTPCDDDDPDTEDDTWTADCECVGHIPCTIPTISAITGNSPICSNGALSMGVSAGGNGPLAYAWTGPGTFSPHNQAANVTVAGAVTGNYTVTVTNECGSVTGGYPVVVNPPLSGSIAYPDDPYCSDGGYGTVMLSGPSGGQYSAAPDGLAFVSGGGHVNLAASNSGTYTVNYTVGGDAACPGFTATTGLTIMEAPAASIGYAAVCGEGMNVVNLSGTAGGTFSATPPGLEIDPHTGTIDMGGSDEGSYTVTYAIPASGGCDAYSASTVVLVADPASATIEYVGSPYCLNGGTAEVLRSGSGGGTFTASPTGLSIDPVSGSINLGASSAGSYVVTYSIASNGPCPAFSTTAAVTLAAAPMASIGYNDGPYCAGNGIAAVSRTGTSGGVYSASPEGLAIDANTGAVTLHTSTPGTYTVTYAMSGTGACGGSSATTALEVSPIPSATISYGGESHCTGSGTAAPSFSGDQGGTFTASPSGLTLNAATGAVDLNASTPGTYTITYSIADGASCAFATTAQLVLVEGPWAAISYSDGPYCMDAGVVSVTLTGTAGGVYSASPAGLGLDPGTGQIDLEASLAGTYTVTYTLAASGSCEGMAATAEVILQTAPAASISYPGSPYCGGNGPGTVVRMGTTGGTYTASPSGLTLDPVSGAIDLGASSAGTYTVTYGIPANGGCGAFSASTEVVLQTPPSATMAYEGSPYCVNGGVVDISFSGTGGGVYSASPDGLGINADEGWIDLAQSAVGQYVVTYFVPASGDCPSLGVTTEVVVTTAPVAAIGYNNSPYCTAGGTATVLQLGTAGGTYGAVPAGLSIDVQTGAIDLVNSAAGSYVITYTIAAHAGCPAFTNSTSFALLNVGDPCDDGNPATVDDVITSDCSCAGDILDGVDAKERTESGLTLYPNPSRSGLVTLHVEGLHGSAGDVEVRVLDAIGRPVHGQQARAWNGSVHEELTLPRDLARGVYLVEVIARDRRFAGRLVIE